MERIFLSFLLLLAYVATMVALKGASWPGVSG